ncbi:hypothetical protein Q8A67_020923 [Cirrhinus molitorella]|uniref:Uncharacterized protein n=1 Tax=Cirrhinus molitorella TaxID=172907 RepID=A0AA88P9M3_9TELE|nr:hypothetical protein Q8A67_020923 [Cirrhinus molitorella]
MSAEVVCVMYHYRPMVEEENPAVVIDEDPVVLLSVNPRTPLCLKVRRTEEEQDYTFLVKSHLNSEVRPGPLTGLSPSLTETDGDM